MICVCAVIPTLTDGSWDPLETRDLKFKTKGTGYFLGGSWGLEHLYHFNLRRAAFWVWYKEHLLVPSKKPKQYRVTESNCLVEEQSKNS